jgi:predicted transcriptional regulator
MLYMSSDTCEGLTVELALESKGKGQPVCFVDADYGGDATTRRSTTGYAFMLFGACVSWQSSARVGCS